MRHARLRLLVLWTLMVLGAGVQAGAQAAPAKASADKIDRWLRGGDPRLEAWGAVFAVRTGDAGELPVLAALAENYQALPPREYDGRGNYVPRTAEQTERFNAMQAVLNALIELHGTVRPEVVAAVLPDFPDQAITLFARMAEPERMEWAAAVYAGRDREDKPYDWRRAGGQRMIHVAAAILAQEPPPGFTATLLNESTVRLEISVRDDEEKRFGIAGAMCGDSFGLVPAPGWPQPYTYVVEQRWRQEESTNDVLVPGEPAITTRQALSNSSCSILPGFTTVQRLQLVQEEAGGPGSGVGATQFETLRYAGAAAYLAAVVGLVEQHREVFRALAGRLEKEGYLTPAEAARAMPGFAVVIGDQRKDRTEALPVVELRMAGPGSVVLGR